MTASPRPRPARWPAIFVAVLGLCAGFLAPSAAAAPIGSPGAPPDVDALVAAVAPSTVDISTNLRYQEAAGTGTGIVLSSGGEVLTNNHVVEGATDVSAVENGTGRRFGVQVLGYDRSRDIALVRLIGADGLRPAAIGDSGAVAPGDPIVAIGNSDGVDGTVAAAPGTVDALNQTVTAFSELSGYARELTGLIEIDADLRPGDSGGPLVNAAGQVIGVNAAGNANFEVGRRGTGFAIPISQALGIANQIRAGVPSDTVHIGPTPFLGIAGTGLDDVNVPGVLVRDVLPDTPAAALGLRGGDVIVSFDNQPVDNPTTLATLIDRHVPGDRVTVGWIDPSGAARSGDVVLVAGPVG
ncbi:S1C family serine protease [Mycobacterium sp. MYCO198283]|uniref:S1C family serine protease n=1 Tax=Mycobacterium sp. MYCO198283 TaxID=2883505 RepID=UPI001E316F2D|nr:trypsin-like peptidase domain-containing protein [Mycobacterium sp. MYCO198283]MCG5434435.1 S1C family serine protease [Mycobacterium sp. MYCO198283]